MLKAKSDGQPNNDVAVSIINVPQNNLDRNKNVTRMLIIKCQRVINNSKYQQVPREKNQTKIPIK